MTWLLLLHQIPPKPPYLRAKILRRLAQVGALPVKNSAYLLPDTEEMREDFEWLIREITAEGGAAWLFRAEGLGEFNAYSIEQQFRQLRTGDYEELIASAAGLLAENPTAGESARICQRFEELKRIDFFEHPLRGQAAELIGQLKAHPVQPVRAVPAAPGRVWVTRRGIKVDRIASAWVIRRFIDPQAAFRFVDTSSYQHVEPELRFDMFEGEYTHVGDLCTFEVLVAAHDLAAQHPGLRAIAEIVHDIDLKENRYERPETSGLARMLEGLCARTADDQERLLQGGYLFDSLLQSFLP